MAKRNPAGAENGKKITQARDVTHRVNSSSWMMIPSPPLPCFNFNSDKRNRLKML
jgi:hypothetical protein